MGKFTMPRTDHVQIRTSGDMQEFLRREAAAIKTEADRLADASDGGYGTDLTVGTDRARAHVWPASRQSYRAEQKTAPLMKIVAAKGGGP